MAKDQELKTIMGTSDGGQGLLIDDSLETFKKAVFDAIAESRPPDRIFVPYHYNGSERYVRLDQITWFGRQYLDVPEASRTAARH